MISARVDTVSTIYIYIYICICVYICIYITHSCQKQFRVPSDPHCREFFVAYSMKRIIDNLMTAQDYILKKKKEGRGRRGRRIVAFR